MERDKFVPVPSGKKPEVEKGELTFSQTSQLAPSVVAQAIREIEKLAKVRNPNWQWPQGELPRVVAEELESPTDPIERLRDYLKAKASRCIPDPVNAFLKENGIPLRLDNLNDPNSLYSAAILQVMAKWLSEGKRFRVQLPEGDLVPAVSMVGKNNCPKGVDIYQTGEGKNPLVTLKTANDPNVHFLLLKVTDSSQLNPSEAFKLMRRVSNETTYRNPITGNYRGVVFPMVDFALNEERLPELVGASFDEAQDVPLSVIIAQAKAFLSLKMNEKGAKAEAAAAIGATRGFSTVEPKPLLIINGPFIVGVSIGGRVEMVFPIKQEHMKDPGEIGDWGRGQQDPLIYSAS